MLGQIGHSERQRPRRAHVVKHHDGAGHLSSAVVDGCGGILDGGFDSVAPDQDAVRGEAHGLVFPNRQRHGIRHGFASGGIDDPEHFLERMTCCLLPRPARHAFSDHIEIGHIAPDVGAHDRVADGVERDLCALLFFEQRLCVRRALDHAAAGPSATSSRRGGPSGDSPALHAVPPTWRYPHPATRSGPGSESGALRERADRRSRFRGCRAGRGRPARPLCVSVPCSASLVSRSSPSEQRRTHSTSKGPSLELISASRTAVGIRGIVLDQKYVAGHRILPEALKDARPPV